MDEALVPHAQRLRIGKSNFRLLSDIKSKESTLQLVYDVLRICPFFKAILVTADVPEIYMDMLHICPRVHGQSFDEPPFKEEILAFICFLRHSAAIRMLIDESNAYKEYYAIAIGAAPPKPKASARRTRSSSDTSITPPTSVVAITEAQQLKLVTKRSIQQTYISQASSSYADEGTGSIPGVPNAPTDESEEELSWNSTDDEGADNEGKDGDGVEEDEGDDGEEGDSDDDDDEDADGEEGGDDDQEFDKEEYAEETRDEESFDPIPRTPKNSDDEGNGDEDLGLNVGGEEGHVEEEEEDELYRDVNINQGRGLQTTLEVEYSHVTLTSVNPNGNKSIQRSDEQRNLYKALVEAYEFDKIILDTYEKTVTLKRRRDDDANKDEEPSARPDQWSKRRRVGKEPESVSAPTKTANRSTGAEDQPIVQSSRHPEWFSQQQKPPSLDRDWNNTPHNNSEKAPRFPEYVPDPIELEDHVLLHILEHPEDLVPAEDEAPIEAYILEDASAPTPPLPPSFLSLRIRPLHTRAAMAQMRAVVPSTYHSLLPSKTPPLLPIPLPVPSTSRRAEIPKADMPPRKRLLLTAPRPGCEVGESSAIAAARQPGPTMARSVDCSFVDTIKTRFQDTEKRMMTVLEMVNVREDRAGLRAEIERQTADDFAVQHIMRTQALEAGARIDTLEDTEENGTKMNYQELALLCGKMFSEESDKIEKYIRGLPDMIHRSVVTSKPKTMQEAVAIATELMDQKIRTFVEREMASKRKLENTSRSTQNQQQQPNKRQNTGQVL
nr:hypothetical protein [Tanacetum cinerariifolium]